METQYLTDLAFKLRRNNQRGDTAISIAADHLDMAVEAIKKLQLDLDIAEQKLQGFQKRYIKIYEANIPECCSLKTFQEHADELMLCWGITAAIESGTSKKNNCGICEYNKDNNVPNHSS